MSEATESSSLKNSFADLMLRPTTQVRIKVKDGRVIHGNFSCLDSDFNFILDNAIEFYGDFDIDADFSSDDIVKRNLGMALIAGQYIVRVCVQEGDEVV